VNLDSDAGKTKLPVHQFTDGIRLNVTNWTGKPTNGELNTAFALSGQSFDPTDSQVADLDLLKALPALGGQAKRTAQEIEAVLRLGEGYPTTIDSTRVQEMLGVTLSAT
jgi:hypothetical protein